jgi:hypothetical protein
LVAWNDDRTDHLRNWMRRFSSRFVGVGAFRGVKEVYREAKALTSCLLKE